MQDISRAQEQKSGFLVGPEWLSWRDHPKTQEILKWMREELIGNAQDVWANGGFSTWESNLLAQGGVKALSRFVMHIESIQLEIEPLKQEQENEE